jgi:hypothetical protein
MSEKRGRTTATGRRAELNRLLRLAFLRGTELQSQLDHGRPLSDDELRRILVGYPGDVTADNGLARIVGSAPLFQGKAVVVAYGATVRDPRIVAAQLHGLVTGLDHAGVSEDELILGIRGWIAGHDGLVARLVSRTAAAIEFSVMRQQVR